MLELPGAWEPQAIRQVHRLVRVKKPRFVFLIETKVKFEKLQRLRCSIGFDGVFHVDLVGRSGGLVMLWKDDREVQIVNFSQRHIMETITLKGEDFSWTFTGFYGHPDRSVRENSWKLLSHMSTLSNSAWLCMGDFNEIVHSREKVGGAIRSATQMRKFRATLDECNLGDLGYQGSKFTWSNKQASDRFVKE